LVRKAAALNEFCFVVARRGYPANMGSSFDEQVAAARKEMQKKRAEMGVERADRGASARRVADPSDTSTRQRSCDLIAQDSIDKWSVSIYSNGYVQVGVRGGGQVEKLISIDYSANLQKKSAMGRGAVAVVTLGLNLMGPKQRGDVWLTIVTDRNVYTLHEDPPTKDGIRAAQQLAAAGQSVLARLAAKQAAQVPDAPTPAEVTPPSTEQRSVTDRLKELTKLHEQGMVSDDEFKELRTNLLKEL
jgi:hypothetical protein